jgi:hypothetical protein
LWWPTISEHVHLLPDYSIQLFAIPTAQLAK